MTPYFSIVIPTYNQSKYLELAIKSLIGQLEENWEAIIVDNFSTDKTEEVVKKFSDPRILYYKLKNNGIISLSRNFALDKSRGKWVAFLDSDDYWDCKKLAELRKMIEQNEILDFICHDEYIVDANNKVLGKLNYGFFLKQIVYADLLVYGNCISTSSSAVSKLFLEINQIRFNAAREAATAEDYLFWLDIFFCEPKYKFIRKYLGFYRIHDNNNSGPNLHHRHAVQWVIKKQQEERAYSFMNATLECMLDTRLRFHDFIYKIKKYGIFASLGDGMVLILEKRFVLFRYLYFRLVQYLAKKFI